MDDKSGKLAKLAGAAVQNSGDIKKILEAASVIVSAATVAGQIAQPVVERIDKEDVAAKAKMAAEGIGKGAKAAAEGIGKGIAGIKAGAGAAAGAIGGAAEKLKQAKEESDRKKAILKARQAVLESASTIVPLEEFVGNQKRLSESSLNGLDAPGCFVIATYRKRDRDKDYTDFTGIYIGSGESISRGAMETCSREGNPDVYADFKFQQNMLLFVFPSKSEVVESRCEALIQALSDERSYNL